MHQTSTGRTRLRRWRWQACAARAGALAAVAACADAAAPGGVSAGGASAGAGGSPSGSCDAAACSAPSESPLAQPPSAPDGPVTPPSGSGEGPPAIGGIAQDADGGGIAAPALDAGARELDRCDVGALDPARPPRALELRGNLGAHDPVIIFADGAYRYFSTGDGISVKTSADLLQWTQQPEVFAATPAWFSERVPAYAPRNIWAPDVSFFGGQYHLYYSVSSFGSNRSCIGHATRASFAAGQWQDHEAIFCSNPPGQVDDFNAIDPNVILDEAGTPWLAFGSFWGGIQMIRLGPGGEREGSELIALASRGGGAIEAPFIVRRCGYYYLFVSFDACCRGADSTYNLRVGRSRELRGPYVARDGAPMLEGGGTLVLEAGGDWVGPGHNAVLFDGTRAYNVYHAYAATNGASQLRIAELAWDGEGWPVSGGP